ncbi:MAG: hypothetical protein IT552_02035 [Sphingomonadaceae bacterium]|nr:hypothetical protein [Sphingomonadaceae bacterium]
MILLALALAAAAQSTTLIIPDKETISGINQRLRELEGIGEVNLWIDGSEKLVWDMEVSRTPPMQRYYDACRQIALVYGIKPNVDVRMVIDLKAAKASEDASSYSLGRFNCASWTHYTF